MKKLANKLTRKLIEVLKELISVMHILDYILNKISEQEISIMWQANTKIVLTKFVILTFSRQEMCVIFHNLKWYYGLPMMLEISNFDGKINVMLTGIEKYMAFMSGEHLLFWIVSSS